MAVETFEDLIPNKNMTGFDDLVPQTSVPSGLETFGMSLSHNIPAGGKITSGLAAGALSPFLRQENENLADTYSRLYQEGQAYQSAGEEANPISALLGMGTGIALTLPLASAKVLWGGTTATTGIRGAVNEIPNILSKTGNFVRGGQIAKDATLGTRAAALALRTGKSAVVAAPTAGLYEMGVSETGDPMGDFMRGAGVGAAFGAGAPLVGAAASTVGRAVTPKIDEALVPVVALAKKYNIPLSINQITGGRAINAAQKVSQDIPFSGQEGFRDKQMRALNKALLKTVGIDNDKFSRPVIEEAYLEAGKRFDKLTKGKTFNITNESLDRLSEIEDFVQSRNFGDIGPKAFKKHTDEIFARVKGNTLEGDDIVKLRNKFALLSRTGSNVDAKELASTMEAYLADIISDGAPKALRDAKQKYKNLIVLEPLMAKIKGGNIAVGELTTRVNKVYGRQFIKGQAGEMGELADIGRELLLELGGSDTQTRQMISNLTIGTALGSYFIDPVIMFGAGGIASVNRAIQSGVNRNQAIINAMTKEARNQFLALPPAAAQKTLDDIAVRLGIGTTLGVTE
jgi:hypothetical protein